MVIASVSWGILWSYGKKYVNDSHGHLPTNDNIYSWVSVWQNNNPDSCFVVILRQLGDSGLDARGAHPCGVERLGHLDHRAVGLDHRVILVVLDQRAKVRELLAPANVVLASADGPDLDVGDLGRCLRGREGWREENG